MKIKEYLQYERNKYNCSFDNGPCDTCKFKDKKIIYCYKDCHKVEIVNSSITAVRITINLGNRNIRLFTHED